jgi:hypothetical protein
MGSIGGPSELGGGGGVVGGGVLGAVVGVLLDVVVGGGVTGAVVAVWAVMTAAWRTLLVLKTAGAVRSSSTSNRRGRKGRMRHLVVKTSASQVSRSIQPGRRNERLKLEALGRKTLSFEGSHFN